jgi:GT2 family glycosyltransferase
MNLNKKIGIILVNWNGSDDTINCLNSIQKSTFHDYFIVVVDNGSNNDQLLKIKNSVVNFDLIEAKENLGYTGGNNLGIEYALTLNPEFILLLNNDTYIHSNALQAILLSAASDRSIGILSPKILFHPLRNLIWSAGTILDKRFLMGHLRGYKTVDIGQFDDGSEADYVTGCAMLIRTQVIRDIGFLCDDYFAVCEDLDYCARAKRAGYRILYVPQSVVWHVESASSGGHEAPQYVYYQTRNYFIYHTRWAGDIIQLLISRSYFYLWITKRFISCLMRGRWRTSLGILYGLSDAIRGKTGRQTYTALVNK